MGTVTVATGYGYFVVDNMVYMGTATMIASVDMCTVQQQ